MCAQIRRRVAGERSRAHQRHRAWTVARAGIAGILLLTASSLSATTLVVKLDNGRIILAADTRQERLNPGVATVVRSAGDDSRCKVRSLGGIGFAVTGLVEYRGGNSSALPDWTANRDASEAFDKVGDKVRAVAADWAQRAASHFSLLYGTNPAWLKQLASTNPEGLLQVAFFAGWDKDSPLFLMEVISFDPASIPVIRVREQSQLVGNSAFSTNAITQELIDGETDRAASAADQWDAVAQNVATQDLGWRHIEFYIERTASFDPDVSPIVDILAIRAGKPAMWLLKGACS